MTDNFPYEITPVEDDVNEELLRYFHGERTGFVQVGPQKYFFPYKYKTHAAGYYNFQARPDDVWVVTFPRSGTTWTQELVWLVANNLDFERAQTTLLTERFPFFEFPLFVHPDVKEELLQENADDPAKMQFIENIAKPGYETLSAIKTTNRRFIKTHFPFSLLPPSVMQQNCKVIYVSRNPLDVAVSYYHLNRLYRTQGYVGDFPRYWKYFEKGLNLWMPYHSHIKEAHQAAKNHNVLFLRYEDMLKDLQSCINNVAEFLECPLAADGVENLINHLNIKNFRLNTSVNGHEMANVGVLNTNEQGFVRAGGSKGEPKEFADHPELLAKAMEWCEKQEKLCNM